MKTALLVISILFGSLILIGGGGLAATYFTYANKGVTSETRLKSVYEENQVVLNTYTTKVQEIAQVPEMYKNDLKEVIAATFNGRYGDTGSKAVVSFMRESNMPLDPGMYTQIQRVMESGRNDFDTAQKKLIDVRNTYQAQLDYVWSGFWLKLAGFPKVNMADYKTLVLDDVASKFKSGQDSVIQLRK
jgi:hypothetical protein